MENISWPSSNSNNKIPTYWSRQPSQIILFLVENILLTVTSNVSPELPTTEIRTETVVEKNLCVQFLRQYQDPDNAGMARQALIQKEHQALYV